MIISKILTYAYRMVVARIGTEEYGVLSLGLAILGFVSVFPILGLDNGILRFVSDCINKGDKNKAKTIILSSLAIVTSIGLIFSILFFLFSNNISFLFNEPRLSNVIKLLAICLPFIGAGNIFLSTITSFKNTKYVVLIKNISENLIKIIITIILIFFGLSYIGATIGHVIAIVSTAIIAFLVLNKKMLKINFLNGFHFFLKKEILIYSIPLMFYLLISQIISWIDIIMIGYFKTSSEVGIYNAALPTASLMSLFPSGLVALFIPVMSGLYLNTKTGFFKKTFKSVTKWIFFINLPLMFVIILFSRQILKIIFGSNYIIGYTSLNILVLGYFVHQLFMTSSQMLNVLKKSKLIMINMIIASILNIIINYFLIPKYGMIGGAIATTISMILYGLLNGICSYYFTRIVPFKLDYIKSIIAVFISSTLVIIVMNFITTKTYLNQFILLSSYFVVYSVLMLLFKAFEKEDYDIFYSLIKRIKIMFNKN